MLAQASETARLEWLLFPRSSAGKLLMFAAYFDDAGTHDETGRLKGSEVAVAAGYVGHASEWDSLESEWNALLARESLKYYHAVDCAHGFGFFESRSVQDRNRIHRECVEIITRHNIMPIGSAVATAAHHQKYTQWVPEERRVKNAGYYQAVYHTLRNLGQFVLSADPRSKVASVFEHSPDRTKVTLGAYDAAIGTPAWREIAPVFAGPPLFRGKPGYPQLQAADVLAYEMSLQLRRQFGYQQYRRRGSWIALAEHAREQSKAAGLGVTFLLFRES